MNKKGIFLISDACLETAKNIKDAKRSYWQAPELANIKSFWQDDNWKSKQNININKSDLYSFGLIILRAALMIPIDQL